MTTAAWFPSLPARSAMTPAQRDVLDELNVMLDHFEPAGFDREAARATLEAGSLHVTMEHATDDVWIQVQVGEVADVMLTVEEAPPREWRIGPDDRAEADEPWTSRTVDLLAGIINGAVEREDAAWGSFRIASSLWLRTDDGRRHALARPAGLRRLLRVTGVRSTRSIRFRG